MVTALELSRSPFQFRVQTSCTLGHVEASTNPDVMSSGLQGVVPSTDTLCGEIALKVRTVVRGSDPDTTAGSASTKSRAELSGSAGAKMEVAMRIATLSPMPSPRGRTRGLAVDTPTGSTCDLTDATTRFFATAFGLVTMRLPVADGEDVVARWVGATGPTDDGVVAGRTVAMVRPSIVVGSDSTPA